MPFRCVLHWWYQSPHEALSVVTAFRGRDGCAVFHDDFLKNLGLHPQQNSQPLVGFLKGRPYWVAAFLNQRYRAQFTIRSSVLLLILLVVFLEFIDQLYNPDQRIDVRLAKLPRLTPMADMASFNRFLSALHFSPLWCCYKKPPTAPVGRGSSFSQPKKSFLPAVDIYLPAIPTPNAGARSSQVGTISNMGLSPASEIMATEPHGSQAIPLSSASPANVCSDGFCHRALKRNYVTGIYKFSTVVSSKC